MDQVVPDRLADDAGLGFPPADASHQAVLLQAQEGAERAVDVVALGAGGSHFRPLHAAVLLEATVIDRDAPGPLGILAPGQLAHPKVARRPIPRVPVWVDDPENQDEAVALRVDARAARRDGAGGERRLPPPSGLTVRFAFSCVTQRQPWPRSAFRFSRLAYQLSKTTQAGAKPRPLAAASMARR